MEGEEARGAEGHLSLAVSHLGPARQTQVGNADSALVFQVENFDAEVEQKYSDKGLKISQILHLPL